jgi:hypothetical protein
MKHSRFYTESSLSLIAIAVLIGGLVLVCISVALGHNIDPGLIVGTTAASAGSVELLRAQAAWYSRRERANTYTGPTNNR